MPSMRGGGRAHSHIYTITLKALVVCPPTLQGHDPDSLSSELARMTGISDFVTLSAGWEPPSAEPPAGPATPAVVDVDADVADLLDGVATASRTRSLATLANLEGIAVHHGLLDADQAQLLAHWLDTLQTAL